MPDIRSKQADTTRYTSCPKCGGTDLRGPYDSPPSKAQGHLIRAWMCRTCWWEAHITLRDDEWLTAQAQQRQERMGR